PGATAGPESPPLSAASRESSRRPPLGFDEPWHSRQCSASTGRTRASKNSTCEASGAPAGDAPDADAGDPVNREPARAAGGGRGRSRGRGLREAGAGADRAGGRRSGQGVADERAGGRGPVERSDPGRKPRNAPANLRPTHAAGLTHLQHNRSERARE